MATLKFTLKSNLGRDVVDTASEVERKMITAQIVADLRAAANQIELQGLSGLWENVRGSEGANNVGLYDKYGYPRIRYAIKRDNPHNTSDVPGPACPAIGAAARAKQKTAMDHMRNEGFTHYREFVAFNILGKRIKIESGGTV